VEEHRVPSALASKEQSPKPKKGRRTTWSQHQHATPAAGNWQLASVGTNSCIMNPWNSPLHNTPP
jgi:hypothetical protein